MRDAHIVKASVSPLSLKREFFFFFFEKWRTTYPLVVLTACPVRKCAPLNVAVLILDFMFLMIKMF